MHRTARSLAALVCIATAQCGHATEDTATTEQAVTPTLVQAESATANSNKVSAKFTKAQAAGDLVTVAIGWNAASGSVSSVKDTSGNVYTLATGPTLTPAATGAVYYAANIKAAAAGANTVTVTLSASEQGVDLRVAEFSGALSLDVAAGASANGNTLVSPAVTTTAPGDLLVGAAYVSGCVTGNGAGYTEAVRSAACNDLEYDVAGAAGSYTASWATSDGSGWGLAQVAAFRTAATVDAGADAAAEVGVDAPIDTAPDVAPDVTSEAGTADVTVDGSTGCWPIRASANGRYLTCQDGTPWLLVGDSPHPILALASQTDSVDGGMSTLETYIADRARLGFNALLVQVLIATYVDGWSNGYTTDGVPPFTVGGNPNMGGPGQLGGFSHFDFSTPNEAYFARLDAILAMAARYGIVVLLDPMDTGISDQSSWLPQARSNGVAKMTAYGQYLGARYASAPNIIWHSGNDFFTWATGNGDAQLVAAIMSGIAVADANHLQTLELGTQENSSDFDSFFRVTLNGAYTYTETYDQILQGYALTPARPEYLDEANYELDNPPASMLPQPATALNVRQQEWWVATSGGCGQLYGQYYTWRESGLWGFPDWLSHIDSPGALEVQYWSGFLRSIPWYALVPDTGHAIVTAGLGSYSASNQNLNAATYVTVAGTPDHTTAVAYDVAGASLTVNLGWFAGPVTVQWYDPSAGTYVSVGAFTNSGARAFGTPGSNHDGSRDWVLLMASM